MAFLGCGVNCHGAHNIRRAVVIIFDSYNIIKLEFRFSFSATRGLFSVRKPEAKDVGQKPRTQKAARYDHVLEAPSIDRIHHSILLLDLRLGPQFNVLSF
jgi:hypothetical protein